MYFYNLFRNVHQIRTKFSLKFCTNIAKNEFTPVYKFPYIRSAAVVNKLKLYQTTLTAISIPSSFILCNYGVIPLDMFLNTFVLGITGTLSLFLFGMIPYKLIGFVYIKNDNQTAKLSYLDFWGKRKDMEIPISDLVPICDLPAIPTDPIFLTMRRFSCAETFKINLKYGIVLEKTKFNTVFLQSM